MTKNSCSIPNSKVPEITPLELKQRLERGEKITIIDVREQDEYEICQIGGKLIPIDSLPQRHAEVPKTGTVVIHCRSGGRSHRAVEFLMSAHAYNNVFNLVGGILRWADEVDKAIIKY